MGLPRLVAGWNARDGREVAAAFVPHGVRHEYALSGARLDGRDAIAARAAGYISAVPDCVLDVRGTDSSGPLSVLEWTFRGTHTGDLAGLPARGADLTLHGVSVCLMAGDLIAEEHVYFDGTALLAAAGVLPG